MERFCEIKCKLSKKEHTNETIIVTGVMPSQYTFKVKILQPNNNKYMSAEILRNYVDMDTGEVLDNPVQYFRERWADSIVAKYKGLPLQDAIDALPIDGIGPSTAKIIAQAIRCWEKFIEAIEQLRTYDLPKTRDDLWLMMDNTFDNEDDNSISQNVETFRSYPNIELRVSVGPISREIRSYLPDKPIPPLLNLFEASGIGLQTLKKLKLWAESAALKTDINIIEQLGVILPYADFE